MFKKGQRVRHLKEGCEGTIIQIDKSDSPPYELKYQVQLDVGGGKIWAREDWLKCIGEDKERKMANNEPARGKDLARARAAQAWCQPTTEKLVMIPELAEAFAEILDEIWRQPWLGNATNLQLIEELYTRHKWGHTDPNYKSTN